MIVFWFELGFHRTWLLMMLMTISCGICSHMNALIRACRGLLALRPMLGHMFQRKVLFFKGIVILFSENKIWNWCPWLIHDSRPRMLKPVLETPDTPLVGSGIPIVESDNDQDLSYFNRPGHSDAYNAMPTLSPPPKKLKPNPKDEPQSQEYCCELLSWKCLSSILHTCIIYHNLMSLLPSNVPLCFHVCNDVLHGKHAQTSKDENMVDDAAPTDAVLSPRASDWKHAEVIGIYNHCLPQTRVPPICGKILLHCKNKVDSFREQMGLRITVFKLGCTSCPIQRFELYQQKNFQKMWILATSDSVDLNHMLEAALISEYHKHVGCRNKEGSGGDGALNRKPPAPPPYFVYIAGGRADQSKRVG